MSLNDLFMGSGKGGNNPVALVRGPVLRGALREVWSAVPPMRTDYAEGLSHSLLDGSDDPMRRSTVALNRIMANEGLNPTSLADYLEDLVEFGPAVREWLSTRLDEELDSLNRSLTHTPRHLKPS